MNQWYRILQNGFHRHHLTHDSPLNFDLTLKARVAEDVAQIASLDISNGGLHGVASTRACLQTWESTNHASANCQKWVQSLEVSRASHESNDVCNNHFTKPFVLYGFTLVFSNLHCIHNYNNITLCPSNTYFSKITIVIVYQLTVCSLTVITLLCTCSDWLWLVCYTSMHASKTRCNCAGEHNWESSNLAEQQLTKVILNVSQVTN